MKRIAILAALAALTSCTGQHQKDARTALAVADEACDVLLILEDEAKEVCVPIEQLHELAEIVLAKQTEKRDVDASKVQRLTIKARPVAAD